MHYKLLGFSQTDSERRFVFQRVLGNGTASTEYDTDLSVHAAANLAAERQDASKRALGG